MGCDIHLYVEYRTAGTSAWLPADEWKPDEYDASRLEVDYDKRFYTGRNYDLFAILAGVRNGRGFAGVKTGEGFLPIAEPRGVPADCCAQYAEEVAAWDVDGHSHSHLTLAELLAYDWTQETGHGGVVTLPEWGRWKTKGKPRSWSASVMGGKVVMRTTEEVEAALKRCGVSAWDLAWEDEAAISKVDAALGEGTNYCRVSWTEPYYVSAASFLSGTLPRLLRLGAPEDVRILFFFDN